MTGADLGVEMYEGQVKLYTTYTFNNDGTYSMITAVDDVTAFESLMLEFVYMLYDDQVAREEIDAFLITLTGKTLQQTVDEICNEMLGASEQGVYYVADDQLYLGQTRESDMVSFKIVFNGDILQMYDPDYGEMLDYVKI